MDTQINFLGELELAEDFLRDTHLADFAAQPMVQQIWEIARAFSGRIELMPYQRDGDVMRLLVSVYLIPMGQIGKVIAVLTREPYPADRQGLQILIRKASSRLAALGAISHRFEAGSILQAKAALAELAERVEESAV